MKNHIPSALTLAVSLVLAQAASAQIQGPSTGSTPYVVPVKPYIETRSIFTVDNTGANPDDTVGGYGMVGIPDGLGAYDNGNGTFTVLMNHELGNTLGAVRAHGQKGAFVSEWVIDKNTLSVSSGADLMTNIFQWNTGTQSVNASPVVGGLAFNRLCSADLAAPTAYFNAGSGLGTTERIFMTGEESGPFGWQMGVVATGASKGSSYVLGKFNLTTNGSATSTLAPVQLNVATASTLSSSVTYSGVAPVSLAVGAQLLGQTVTAINTITSTITLSGNSNATIASVTPTNFTLAGVGGWENAVANPFAQDKTVVVANNDGGTGIMANSVSVYVGTKTSSGTALDKAGLTNGTLKFVNVAGNTVEITNGTTRATGITSGTGFTLSATASTIFSRPEDVSWNPANPSQAYFVTTDRIDQVSDGVGTQVGATRLWRLNFADITNPDLGGTIDLLVDGDIVDGRKVNMFDNITVSPDGMVFLQEDVGNAAHNGKIFMYDPNTDTVTQITMHDENRFGNVGLLPTSPFSADEEGSGIIDITDLMAGSSLNIGYAGERWLLSTDQAHYTTGLTAAQVEGGQLFAIHVVPEPSAALSLLSGMAMLLGLRRRRA